MTVGVDVASLVAGLVRGDRRALARLLTVVEDGEDATRRDVLARLPVGEAVRVIGITGPPGVGKSTLTAAVAGHLRRRGRRVAVLAVDPSSPTTGGALLGDRVRMQVHHDDEGVFVRSMASRGHLGGLAAAVPSAVTVLGAAGFDDVLVETVGVGQSEVEVVGLADTTVLVLAPGMGDAVQAAKAGILEVVDVYVVNKADQGGAGRLESELRGMLELGHALDGAAPAAIVRCVAVRDEGVAEVLDAIDAHAGRATPDDRGLARARAVVRAVAAERVRRDLEATGSELLDAVARRVRDRELDPFAAADAVLAAWAATRSDAPGDGRVRPPGPGSP